MTEHTIIIIALIFIYYHIGGLATTNILRLTAGNSLTVNSLKCICDNCGSRISPLLQLPIISYIVCGGKCKDCGTRIPVYPLVLEIIVICGMSLISILLSIAPIGIIASFIFYEIIRIITIKIKGKRTIKFKQQYFVAVISMFPFLLAALFISLLYHIV